MSASMRDLTFQTRSARNAVTAALISIALIVPLLTALPASADGSHDSISRSIEGLNRSMEQLSRSVGEVSRHSQSASSSNSRSVEQLGRSVESLSRQVEEMRRHSQSASSNSSQGVEQLGRRVEQLSRQVEEGHRGSQTSSGASPHEIEGLKQSLAALREEVRARSDSKNKCVVTFDTDVADPNSCSANGALPQQLSIPTFDPVSRTNRILTGFTAQGREICMTVSVTCHR